MFNITWQLVLPMNSILRLIIYSERIIFSAQPSTVTQKFQGKKNPHENPPPKKVSLAPARTVAKDGELPPDRGNPTRLVRACARVIVEKSRGTLLGRDGNIQETDAVFQKNRSPSTAHFSPASSHSKTSYGI